MFGEYDNATKMEFAAITSFTKFSRNGPAHTVKRPDRNEVKYMYLATAIVGVMAYDLYICIAAQDGHKSNKHAEIRWGVAGDECDALTVEEYRDSAMPIIEALCSDTMLTVREYLIASVTAAARAVMNLIETEGSGTDWAG